MTKESDALVASEKARWHGPLRDLHLGAPAHHAESVVLGGRQFLQLCDRGVRTQGKRQICYRRDTQNGGEFHPPILAASDGAEVEGLRGRRVQIAGHGRDN